MIAPIGRVLSIGCIRGKDCDMEYKMIYCKKVLQNWNFADIEILEQFNKNSPRLIFKIQADGCHYILKGIPFSKPENVVLANTLAHEYLGNQKGIAPRIIYLPDGRSFIESDGFRFYLTEFIEGRPMAPTAENEYQLGRLVRSLHSYTDFNHPSGLNENKQRFYEWFPEKSFKTEFNALLNSLPDFSAYDRCFIHTDLGPHNTMIKPDGRLVLIDLDDAGIGSRYLDLGYAFIMRFVEHTEDMQLYYRFDLAKAFLEGYYGDSPIPRFEYDFMWHGAVQMHISYMQSFGYDAVDSLWKILKFGIEQKEKLWAML